MSDKVPHETSKRKALDWIRQPGHQPAVERYQNDAEFHYLVDLMYALMYKGEATGRDLREAVTLAVIKYRHDRGQRSPSWRAGAEDG